jgi:hypothetical protein
MKKIFGIILIMILMIGSIVCEGAPETASVKTGQSALVAQENAFAQIPVPNIQYFVERQTISKWAQRWNKPQVTTYVYLLSFSGNFIGYYVCNGKPASTKSYLIPEQSYQRLAYGNSGSMSSWELAQSPDLDGTYGDNNAGIRFFTAEGIAVEAGNGISYIYSDAPLPVNCPKLNVTRKESK